MAREIFPLDLLKACPSEVCTRLWSIFFCWQFGVSLQDGRQYTHLHHTNGELSCLSHGSSKHVSLFHAGTDILGSLTGQIFIYRVMRMHSSRHIAQELLGDEPSHLSLDKNSRASLISYPESSKSLRHHTGSGPPSGANAIINHYSSVCGASLGIIL